MADIENPPVKDYRHYELEQIVSRTLSDSEQYFNKLRFDIESFIIKKYKLIPTIHFHLKSNHDTWAFLLVSSNRIFMDHQLMDDEKLERKYRFTLGEELAHFLIHNKLYSSWKTMKERNLIYYGLPDKDRRYLESNARALASAFLMPKWTVEPRVSDLLKDSSEITIDGKLDYLANSLMDDYDVNFRAARKRLINLGYKSRL